MRPTSAAMVMALIVWLSHPANGSEITSAAGRIMTVTGPVDPQRVGYTLMHEHVLGNFILPLNAPEKWVLAGRRRPVSATDVAFLRMPLEMSMLGEVMMGRENNDNSRLDSDGMARQELEQFRLAGGTTLVELTSIGAGREPARLRQLSKASGVQMIMGTGPFAPGWFPAGVDGQTMESLTARMVRDITVGAEGTDVRSGIIGEIGIGSAALSGVEEKVIRAAARASVLTGAALSLHVSKDSKEHLRILDILEHEGVGPGRVVFGNANPLIENVGLLEELLRRGVYVQFDGFGRPPRITLQRWGNSEVADVVIRMVRAGHGTRILLSQDVSRKADLRAYGGPGYTFVANSVLPYLRQKGLSDQEIDQLVIGNPRQVLTLVAPSALPEGR